MRTSGVARRRRATRIAAAVVWAAAGVFNFAAAGAAPPDFERDVKPLLVRHCHACHNAEVRKGDVDLTTFTTADPSAAESDRLQMLIEVVGEEFMPPKDAAHPLPAADRKRLVDWMQDRLERTARAQAGDPGRVVIRRLTNAELNYTLADLTGAAIDWTKDFPRDGSGGEGFSNTGQTLQMSAGQIEKYLSLAQRLAACAVVFPAAGPAFTESPAPQSEWSRLALERLDAFCTQHAVEYVDATPDEQLMSYAYPPGKKPKLDVASKEGLRGYKAYSNARPGDPLQFLLTSHRLFYRNERLCPSPSTFAVPQGTIKKIHGRDILPDEALQWERLWLDLRHTTGYARPFKVSLLHRWLSFQPYAAGDDPEFEERLRQWQGKPLDVSKDLSFTVMSLAKYLREIRTFDAAELRDYANIQNSRDGESQGTMVPNHDAFDAFLHDSLTDAQLEAVWRTACDPESALAKRLRRVPPEAMQARWRELDEQQRVWREQVIAACRSSSCAFAERAWRRPLSARETKGFHARIDQSLAEGQSLAEAVRSALVHVFVSPHFLYRIERGDDRVAATAGAPQLRKLNDYELAARLSYFLWSSLPDDELRAAASRGELVDPVRRAAQARRMLRDPRIRRFATEMFGQWLGFYRFDEFTRPDAERFAEFDADLRMAMHDEAVEFCTDLVANDRDVRVLLSADYAFLPTRRLAEHYGLTELGDAKTDVWARFKPTRPIGVVTAPRVSLAQTPRRGVLGWGAVLTAASHPLRTSPVLRGNWILSDLLGIPTPPPPDAVPELPQDEKNSAGLTIGQLLARHRENPACSVCHARIDPLGIALENFDPIGRFRTQDLNGRPINSTARLIDDRPLEGMSGLVAFMNEEKQRRLFVRRLCRKVSGYALGRSMQPGDSALLADMESKLESTNGRFSTIIDALVTSPQFSLLKFEPAATAEGKESK